MPTRTRFPRHHRRYAYGCDQGVWPCRMAYLQFDPDLSAVRLDSTAVRAHMSAAGAPQNREADPALGRNRGGFGTQIHVLAARRGRPLRVTGGQRHDRTQAQALVEAWTGAPRPRLIADRAYDGDAFRAWRAQRVPRPSFRPGRGTRTPSPTPWNSTRRATPWNGASAGSNAGAAGHPL